MINNVTLMGRLTAAPELKQTNSGKSVMQFCIAVDRRYQKDGENNADFINIVVWEKTAEFVSRYFGKGDMIAVIGEIQTRNYEDKNGNKRTAFEVVAREVSFCGKKQESGEKPVTPDGYIPQAYANPQPQCEPLKDGDDLPF